MIRRLAAPAIVLGLSLLSTAALADTPGVDGGSDERPPLETLQQMKPGDPPGLFMQMTGDADATNEDIADPELGFRVSEGHLDKTVALSEEVIGLPNIGINVWRQDGDLKIANSFDSSGFSMDYKLEGGSVSFHTEGVALQTPVDAAGAMTFVGDVVDMGMSQGAAGRP